MKKFAPEMKVVRFGTEDVIATSGVAPAPVKTITISGYGNSSASDNLFVFGPYSHQMNTSSKFNAFRNDLSAYFDADLANKSAKEIMFDGTDMNAFYTNNVPRYEYMNGTYIYDGEGTFSFSKQ